MGLVGLIFVLVVGGRFVVFDIFIGIGLDFLHGIGWILSLILLGYVLGGLGGGSNLFATHASSIHFLFE